MAKKTLVSRLKKQGARKTRAPSLLINQVVVLRAEAWEGGTCATTDDWFAGVVTALGYNLENVNLRSRIAQNIFLHSAFEIKLLNYSVTKVQPS